MGNAYTWRRSIVAPRGFAKPDCDRERAIGVLREICRHEHALHYRIRNDNWEARPGTARGGQLGRPGGALGGRERLIGLSISRNGLRPASPRDGRAPNPPSSQDRQGAGRIRPLAKRLPPSAQK